MAQAACIVHGDPASGLAIVGVTGTNGKTTTTSVLQAIMQSSYETTVIGTLSGARTTPEAPDLQRIFREAADRASDVGRPGAVAMEVTSHALVQHRVDGYAHDVAVFTNLSRDHLDFHLTMEAYFRAKQLLFTPAHATRGVVNADDGYGRRMLEEAEIPIEPFSMEEISELETSPSGSDFQWSGEHVHFPLLGELNVRNALAAAAAARALGIPSADIAAGLGRVSQVPGRFERVENALGLTAVVDYAHTPAGLDEACATMRDLVPAGSRLIVVFGAGGDRDPEKRPLMGHATSTHSDVAVLTSDNPRHEDPVAIIEEVRAGCDGPAELHVEPDRRRAIELGLRLAQSPDVLLVAGKGHETTQQVGDEFLPFDDRLVVAEAARDLAVAR
jgi:UDP-N-acetylmuramoyl-L-alanyl-D-glutamate--2,6-diaminopimelate ligase